MNASSALRIALARGLASISTYAANVARIASTLSTFVAPSRTEDSRRYFRAEALVDTPGISAAIRAALAKGSPK